MGTPAGPQQSLHKPLGTGGRAGCKSLPRELGNDRGMRGHGLMLQKLSASNRDSKGSSSVSSTAILRPKKRALSNQGGFKSDSARRFAELNMWAHSRA